MLNLFLSPYDLTARSRSAALSLLLGDTVRTLAPADLAGPGTEPSESHAASRAEFARQWSWTRDLFDEGILDSDADGPIAAHTRRVWERVGSGTLAAPARRPKRAATALATVLSPDRLIRDLSTGGRADPTVRIAVETAIMRGASEMRTAVARDTSDALLDRLIDRAAEPMARVALPVLDALDEESLLELRRLLLEPIAGVRSAIAEVIDACYAGAEPDRVRDVCDRRVTPITDALVREAVSLETALDSAHSMAGIRAVSVRIGRVASDVVIRAAESAMRGRAEPSSPALVADAAQTVVLSVKPLAWDADSI